MVAIQNKEKQGWKDFAADFLFSDPEEAEEILALLNDPLDPKSAEHSGEFRLVIKR